MNLSEMYKDSDRQLTALVVGGTSGLGLPIVGALAGRGYRVVSVGRGPAPAGATAHFVCDLSDSAAWRKTLDDIRSRHPRISVAGFIAGYARAVHPERASDDERRIHYRLNADYVADAYLSLLETLLPAAKVFTIGSQWTFRRGCRWLIPYITAKHALLAITHELSTLPQAPQVRHYCVPTMSTEAFLAVKDSFDRLELNIEFKELRFEGNVASPEGVAGVLVCHLTENTESGLVWRIDSGLNIERQVNDYNC